MLEGSARNRRNMRQRCIGCIRPGDQPKDLYLRCVARETRFGVLWVLALSGAIGFRVGMVNFPEWQVAVETSQVVAGLVRYPAGNPFLLYHTKLWTLLHQLCAPLLVAGVT